MPSIPTAQLTECFTAMARKKQRIQDLNEMVQEEKKNQLLVRSYEDPKARTEQPTLRLSNPPRHNFPNQGPETLLKNNRLGIQKEDRKVSLALGESVESMEEWAYQGEFTRLGR